jgi:hypothetical protein
MLKRKANAIFKTWAESSKNKTLIILGARQVGKTYLVDTQAPLYFKNVVKFDMVEDAAARKSFESATSSEDLFMRMTIAADKPMVEGETVVFVDEIQECPNIITYAKYLVQNTNYRYVFSGSLLGARLENIDSLPVGYSILMDMEPLDFEEFCWAAGMTEDVTALPSQLVKEGRPIPDYLHERLSLLFKQYLFVGGMPEAVDEFFTSNNVQTVQSVQKAIGSMYIVDITKYAPETDRLKIRQIFELIPSELAAPSKRFRINSIKDIDRYAQIENAFLWLEASSVAIAVEQADEPTPPLLLTRNTSKIKLFSHDVGMLASHYANSASDILSDTAGYNLGAIYENFVAQQLKAQGQKPYYFSSRKIGELDFLFEPAINTVVALEVKSGNSFKTHKALDNAMGVRNWNIARSIVLSPSNYSAENGIEYMPVYLAGLRFTDLFL